MPVFIMVFIEKEASIEYLTPWSDAQSLLRRVSMTLPQKMQQMVFQLIFW